MKITRILRNIYMNTKRHYRRSATFGTAQTSFDPGDGCLNVIDVSYAQGIGEYGDEGVSANYLHEKFINERFSIGAGIGYSQHKNYKFSAIPIYLSTHYFFLDRKFSPFVNLRVGPSVGVKVHITPSLGIMASISDEAYLVNAFDTSRNDYRSKLIHSWGISVGICFQIKGW